MVSMVMGLIILIVVIAIIYLVILYLNGTFSKGGRTPPEDELTRADTKSSVPATPKEAPKTETKPESIIVAPSDAIAVPKEAPVTTINESPIAPAEPPAK